MDYYIQLNNLMVLLDDNEKSNLLQLFSQLEGAAIDMTQDEEADEHQFEKKKKKTKKAWRRWGKGKSRCSGIPIIGTFWSFFLFVWNYQVLTGIQIIQRSCINKFVHLHQDICQEWYLLRDRCNLRLPCHKSFQVLEDIFIRL